MNNNFINRQLMLIIFTSINILWSFSASAQKVNFSHYHSVIFADTISIESPLIVNIDGIGFLNAEKNLSLKNPKRITNNSNCCLVYCDFGDKRIYADYDFVLFSLNVNILDELASKGFYKPITPPFTFWKKIKGCEIYRSEKSVLKFMIFLVQIEYLNEILNPEIDTVNKTKIKKRNIKSSYPRIEYIKVAVPIELD